MAKINTLKKHSYIQKAYAPKCRETQRWIPAVSIKNKIYKIQGEIYINEYDNSAINTNEVEIYDTITDTWTSGTYALYSVSNATVCAFDTKIHILCGRDSSNKFIRYHNVYDTNTNTYKTLNNTTFTSETRGAFRVKNNIYSMSGSNIDIFDTITSTWSVKQNPDTATRTSNCQQIYVDIDGAIYMVGGGSGTLSKYMPSTNTCTIERYLPMNKLKYNSLAYIDKKLYIMNGYNDTSSTSTEKLVSNDYIYVFDTVSKKLSKKFYEEISTSAILCITNNNKIYMFYKTAGNGGDATYEFVDEQEEIISVPDETPKFKYNGKHHFKIKKGEKFTPPNITATSSNGNVNVAMTSNIGDEPGVYEIKYTSGDAEMYITVEREANNSEIINISEGWNTSKEIPTTRCLLGVSTLNGKIYTIGGYTTTYVNTNEMYDDITDKWTAKREMSTTRHNLTSSTLNNKIYAIGGYSSTKNLAYNEMYDDSTDTWTMKKEMTTGRYSLTSSVLNGKIHAIGGIGDSTVYLATNEQYDDITNTWTTKKEMTNTRHGLSSSTLNGKIYAIGGAINGTTSYLSLNEQYDINTNTWSTKKEMVNKRSNLTSSTLNGKIYAIGGYDGNTFNINEEYDDVTNTWTTKKEMTTARRDLGASVLNGKIYNIGGTINGNVKTNAVESYTSSRILTIPQETPKFNYNGSYHFKVKNNGTFTPPTITASDSKGDVPVTISGTVGNEAGIYNLTYTAREVKLVITVERIIETVQPPETKPTEAWEEIDKTSVARSHTAVARVGTNVYAMGGNIDSAKTTNINECLDTSTDTWSVKAPLDDNLNNHSAASVMLDVYVFGGFGANSSATSTTKNRKYDTLTDTWSTKQALPVDYQHHNSETINGKIYVFGSNVSSTDVNNEYNPSTNTWSVRAKRDVKISYATSEVMGHKIYTFGGYIFNSSGLEYAKSIYVYDSVYNTWSNKKDMEDTVTEGSASLLGEMIYVFAHGQVNKYDSTDDTWHKCNKIASLESGVSTISYKDYIYVICGGTTTKTKDCYKFSIKEVPVEPTPDPDPPTPPEGGGDTNESIVQIKKEIDKIKQLIILSV